MRSPPVGLASFAAALLGGLLVLGLSPAANGQVNLGPCRSGAADTVFCRIAPPWDCDNKITLISEETGCHGGAGSTSWNAISDWYCQGCGVGVELIVSAYPADFSYCYCGGGFPPMPGPTGETASAFDGLGSEFMEGNTASYSALITQNTYDGVEQRGTIKFRMWGPTTFNDYVVDIRLPAGVRCTNDYVPPGATLSPLDGTGSSVKTISNHCVYRWRNTAPLLSGSMKLFHYSTDSQAFSAAVTVTPSRANACPAASDPAFCAAWGKNCGSFTKYDNCFFDRTASCGSCSAPSTCGGGGVPNVCGGSALSPTADAYVREGSPSSNFGSESSLMVKNDPGTGNTRKTFLKFDISSIPSVANAKLRLYGSRSAAAPSDRQEAAYAVTNDSWTETGITWNNRPAIGTKQGQNVTIGTTAQYYEFDVTSFVKAERNAGNKRVSLAVLPESTTTFAPDTFNSREASNNRPQLVIVP